MHACVYVCISQRSDQWLIMVHTHSQRLWLYVPSIAAKPKDSNGFSSTKQKVWNADHGSTLLTAHLNLLSQSFADSTALVLLINTPWMCWIHLGHILFPTITLQQVKNHRQDINTLSNKAFNCYNIFQYIFKFSVFQRCTFNVQFSISRYIKSCPSFKSKMYATLHIFEWNRAVFKAAQPTPTMRPPFTAGALDRCILCEFTEGAQIPLRSI